MQQKLRRSQLKHPGIIICERRCGALFPSLPVWRNRNPVRWHSRSDPIGCRARRLCVAILVPSPPSPLSRTLPQGSLRDRMRCHNGNSISQVFFAVPTIVRDVFPNASQASSLPHPAQLIKDYFRHMLQPRVFFSLGGGGGPASQHHFHSQQLQVEPLSPKIGASSRKAGLDPNKTNHWCFWGLGGFRLQILAGNSQPSSFSETPGGWTTYHRSPAGPGARLKVLQKTDGDVSDAKGRDWINGSRGCLERAELGEMAAAHLQSAGGVLCAN